MSATNNLKTHDEDYVEIEDLSGQEDEEATLPEEKTSTHNCNLYNSARFCEFIKTFLETDAYENQFPRKSRLNLTALPTRQYLEATVLPILLQALHFIARERPPEPINALCVYLMKYKSQFEVFCNTESPIENENGAGKVASEMKQNEKETLK